MSKQLQEMNLSELQALFVTDTKLFIDALDNGTAFELLQPMRDRIKHIGSLIEGKLYEPKIEIKATENSNENIPVVPPTFSSPTISKS